MVGRQENVVSAFPGDRPWGYFQVLIILNKLLGTFAHNLLQTYTFISHVNKPQSGMFSVFQVLGENISPFFKLFPLPLSYKRCMRIPIISYPYQWFVQLVLLILANLMGVKFRHTGTLISLIGH